MKHENNTTSGSELLLQENVGGKTTKTGTNNTNANGIMTTLKTGLTETGAGGGDLGGENVFSITPILPLQGCTWNLQ